MTKTIRRQKFATASLSLTTFRVGVRLMRCLFPLLLVVLMIGCGSGGGVKVEFVEGIVTLDNEPVSNAWVAFVPIENTLPIETASGISNERGVYRLTSENGRRLAGAVAGEYKVLISQTTEQPDPFPPVHHLPAIYRNHRNTPLRAIVNHGQNKIDFELTSKATKP